MNNSKREKDVVAWATACGRVDGLEAAIAFVRERAGIVFAQGGQDEVAIRLRELASMMLTKKKEMRNSIPALPQPPPAMHE